MAGIGAAPLTAQEVLYLADTAELHDGMSGLYVVDLDKAANNAVLTLLPAGRVPLNHVDALAASLDGRKLWLIDDGTIATHQLAYYDLSSNTMYPIDFIQGIPDLAGNSIDDAAVSPEGELYVARSGANDLWTIDTATAQATLVGTLTDRATNAPIDLYGGDLTFAPDGTLYLWANNNRTGAPSGLYSVAYRTPEAGVVYATHRGADSVILRGLAMNARGELLGSDSPGDQIVAVNPATGASQEYFAMVENGVAFDHTNGDMAAGPSVRCAKTIGYWKNHGWDGAIVSLNGETIEQDRGHQILWDAHGKNFSMLVAQLIAAKLNCTNCAKNTRIDDAEMFLQSNDVTFDNYDESFLDDQQKRKAAKYWVKLDGFNNQHACD